MKVPDLLEGCVWDTANMTADELLLCKLTVAVGAMAGRLNPGLMRAVAIANREWAEAKGWVLKDDG